MTELSRRAGRFGRRPLRPLTLYKPDPPDFRPTFTESSHSERRDGPGADSASLIQAVGEGGVIRLQVFSSRFLFSRVAEPNPRHRRAMNRRTSFVLAALRGVLPAGRNASRGERRVFPGALLGPRGGPCASPGQPRRSAAALRPDSRPQGAPGGGRRGVSPSRHVLHRARRRSLPRSSAWRPVRSDPVAGQKGPGGVLRGSLRDVPVNASQGVESVAHEFVPRLTAALSSATQSESVRIEKLLATPDSVFPGRDVALPCAMARFFCQWLDERGQIWPFHAKGRASAATDPDGSAALREGLGEDLDAATQQSRSWAKQLRWSARQSPSRRGRDEPRGGQNESLAARSASRGGGLALVAGENEQRAPGIASRRDRSGPRAKKIDSRAARSGPRREEIEFGAREVDSAADRSDLAGVRSASAATEIAPDRHAMPFMSPAEALGSPEFEWRRNSAPLGRRAKRSCCVRTRVGCDAARFGKLRTRSLRGSHRPRHPS